MIMERGISGDRIAGGAEVKSKEGDLYSLRSALPVLRSRINRVGGCALRAFEMANFFREDTIFI